MVRSGAEQKFEAPPSPFRQERIVAFDGLRGLAALIVVIFHFLYMLFPFAVPVIGKTPLVITDTPLAIFWNGRFAVSVFFVLSGFVIAGAAQRRSNKLASNIVTRYVRLALPVTISVIIAWLLLSAFPSATDKLAKVMDSPSHWLNYTHQGLIPPFNEALADGLVGNFVSGGSQFNNVLWTMKIELIGSVGIFFIYWLTSGRHRLVFLTISGLLILFIARPHYLGFITGALMYEIWKKGYLNLVPAWVSVMVFLAGIMLGAPGEGFSHRFDLPTRYPLLIIGSSQGIFPIIAATFIIFSIASSLEIAKVFSSKFLQWLGKVSFALYLIHVPILYTLVAKTYVELDPNLFLLSAGYLLIVLFFAQLFTLTIDEPTLRLFPKIKQHLSSVDNFLNKLNSLYNR